jgi:hypothetical protein
MLVLYFGAVKNFTNMSEDNVKKLVIIALIVIGISIIVKNLYIM